MNIYFTGNQFLVLVCIVAVFLILFVVCLTVCIYKLIDRNKTKREATRQMLMDSSTSHRYSGGPQNNVPFMFNERMEMVPDILENSLPRPTASYAASSESSYQTNYPGTMYYMGQPGQGLQRNSPQHGESIPLPMKPASVSDSESEDLYATIPAY